MYVKDGDPVRIRQTVHAAIWVKDMNGNDVPAEADIQEGWYALPDPGAKK